MMFLAHLLLPTLLSSAEVTKQPEPYPAQVKESFMVGCTNFHQELIPACTCILGEMQKTLTLKQLETLNQSPDITREPAFVNLAQQCISDTQAQKQ